MEYEEKIAKREKRGGEERKREERREKERREERERERGVSVGGCLSRGRVVHDSFQLQYNYYYVSYPSSHCYIQNTQQVHSLLKHAYVRNYGT